MAMTTIVREKFDALYELCERFGVERLWLFGSAAGNSFDAGRSDLDFLVEYVPCTPREHKNRYFGLLAALQELFGREIDLVEVGTVTNPYVMEGVSASLVPVYGPKSESLPL
jgi:predicted nucleotidyltransferase